MSKLQLFSGKHVVKLIEFYFKMTMDNEKLNKFLKALDAVKQDYTCGFCLELCKKPVTLSKCFHIICSAHFNSLSHCPTCNVPLQNSRVFTDEGLETCVNSARELANIFEDFKKKNALKETSQSQSFDAGSKKRARNKSHTKIPTEVSNKENKIQKSNPEVNTPEGSARKKTKSENLNSSILSTNSSKLTKGYEKKNIKGETTLHYTCRLGKADAVIELLKQGANTNTKDNAGWTPLHEVVQNGRLDLVKLLLQYNTLIDVPGQSNETPLHEAIRYNHKDIAVELVKNGANINARNCKGETPLELASDELKMILKEAEENIILTQGVNVSYISDLNTQLDYNDIRVYCVSESRSARLKLKMLVKHHSNLHIEQKFTKKVTHLIVDTNDNVCASSLDVLQGIIYGIWILSVNWLIDATEENLKPFQDYEVKGVGSKTYNGPRNSRYNKYKQLPGIFNGCHFYLHNFNTKFEISKTIALTKATLTKLLTDGGGIVLRRVPNPELIPEPEKLVPYHAKEGSKLFNCSHYIIFKDIYEPMYNMSHIKALPIGWLIECIEKYELCDPW